MVTYLLHVLLVTSDHMIVKKLKGNKNATLENALQLQSTNKFLQIINYLY